MQKRLLFLMVFLMGCKSTPEFHRGENLLQPMPLPENSWSAYQKQNENVYSRLWSKNENKDQMKTDVYRNTQKRDVNHEKEIDDRVGLNKCHSFNSLEITENKKAKYNSLTWISTCKSKSGDEINVLHKAISGADSFYHLRRIWKTGYSNENLAIWTKYFANIIVCDTRDDSLSPCPKDYKKAQ